MRHRALGFSKPNYEPDPWVCAAHTLICRPCCLTNRQPGSWIIQPPTSSAAFTCRHPVAVTCTLQHIDSSLGVEVVYRDYGTSCALFDPSTHTLNWPALRSTLLDEFVLAHSLGWWAKALLIRNTELLWLYSVMFELLELTFAVGLSIAAARQPGKWLR